MTTEEIFESYLEEISQMRLVSNVVKHNLIEQDEDDVQLEEEEHVAPPKNLRLVFWGRGVGYRHYINNGVRKG
jgi:hypothetical protein